MHADVTLPPRPTPEDLEEACRETEHALLACHRHHRLPLVLWRDGRIVRLDPSDPAARAAPGAPPSRR
jgi:hypothetical protein